MHIVPGLNAPGWGEGPRSRGHSAALPFRGAGNDGRGGYLATLKPVLRRLRASPAEDRIFSLDTLVDMLALTGRRVEITVRRDRKALTGKAKDLGNAVVLTGVAAISVNSKGKANSCRVRFTDVYENQNVTWRMITWQSTKLPE
ncbi:MAG: hypothetical protein JWO70_149 [Betaproteobacteria bacterium]|nr:hypothetical protein [Betaproteobacteria bacterium]